jgi:hypothetical protein
MSDLIELGGLWSSKDKNGNLVLSGNFGRGRLVVFKNTFKQEGENSPDYRLYVTAQTKKDDDNTAPVERRDEPGGDDLPF